MNIMGCDIILECDIDSVSSLLRSISTKIEKQNITARLTIVLSNNTNSLTINEKGNQLILKLEKDFFKDFEKNKWIIVQQVVRFLSYLNLKYQGNFILLHGSCAIRNQNSFLFCDFYNNVGKTTASLFLGINNIYIEDEFVILDQKNMEVSGLGIEQSIHLRTDTICFLLSKYNKLGIKNVRKEIFVSPTDLCMKKASNSKLNHLVVPFKKRVSQSVLLKSEDLIEHLVFSHIVKLLYRGFDRFDVFCEKIKPDAQYLEALKKVSQDFEIEHLKRKMTKEVSISILEFDSFEEMYDKVSRL
ncbi:hypothetical protein K1376_000910 [Listeria monocytogenes]|nr:hypothetical protein [Listeria monocytogenes]